MKKSTKIALIFLVTGILISSISYFSGAYTSISPRNFRLFRDRNNQEQYNSTNHYSGIEEKNEYYYPNINTISINGDAVEIKLLGRNIKEWEVYTSSLTNSNGTNKISVEETNGNLVINLKKLSKEMINSSTNSEHKITIMAPMNEIDKFNIDSNVNYIKLDNVNIRDFNLNSSISVMEVENSTIGNSNINTTMSTGRINNSKLSNFNFKTSMSTLNGSNVTFLGSNAIDVSMSTVKLNINDPDNLLIIERDSVAKGDNTLTINSSMSGISINKNQENYLQYEDYNYENRTGHGHGHKHWKDGSNENWNDNWDEDWNDYWDEFGNELEENLENTFNNSIL
ncbi:hypothetical protein EF514_08650 [Anaerosphaera multitolerans]|uniref:Adhesin domain-containing protein n=2 Tax=Anaerosphaera multitolerans TaxID=2487351 RepID=A0A437S5I9_9FIRM|nr:hypothetical protein EF514_08650 [Anaerosphaera multitolerans]